MNHCIWLLLYLLFTYDKFMLRAIAQYKINWKNEFEYLTQNFTSFSVFFKLGSSEVNARQYCYYKFLRKISREITAFWSVLRLREINRNIGTSYSEIICLNYLCLKFHTYYWKLIIFLKTVVSPGFVFEKSINLNVYTSSCQGTFSIVKFDAFDSPQ